MTIHDSLDRRLADELRPLAQAAPLPPALLDVPEAWVRDRRPAMPGARAAVAVLVMAAAAVVTLVGLAALRGELAAPFIGGPRQPIVAASLEPDERRTIEEADAVINTTLTPAEWAVVVNAHGSIVSSCMRERGWDYRVGTATADTEAAEPATMTSLEKWTFADTESAEADGYGFESYLAEHAEWLETLDPDADVAGDDPDAMSPADAERYYVDFFGTDAQRIEITERDGSGAGRAGGGCMATADRALYGDIARLMWLEDARGTAQSDIWMATLENPSVMTALEWWRECVSGRGVHVADPAQAFDAAIRHAQAGDHEEERRIAVADASCKLETGLHDAVTAAFLEATNTVLPDLETDLRALQRLEEEALVRAHEILGD